MYYFDPTFIILIPAVLLTLIAQSKVNSAYRKYSQVRNGKGMTGAQAARILLDNNGLRDVRIEMISGNLTDHYDPRNRVMRLSNRVYNEPSVASISIAAHETGHAIQHAEGYALLKFRNTIVPIVNFTSRLAWPLMLIGLLVAGAGNLQNGYMIMDIGILFFAFVVLFHGVTLPVELNASNRAIKEMEEYGIIYNEERKGARKVLSAAALTYLAALATAVANLLRLLAIRERNR